MFEPAAVPAGPDPVEPAEAPVVPFVPPVVFPVPSPFPLAPLPVFAACPEPPLLRETPELFPPQLSKAAKQNAAVRIAIAFRMYVLSFQAT